MSPLAPCAEAFRKLPLANWSDELEIVQAHSTQSSKRKAATAFAGRELIDLTDEYDYPRLFQRKRNKLSKSSGVNSAPLQPAEDMSAIFKDLSVSAMDSLSLLEPLSMLQEWHTHGPTPSKQYEDASFAVLSAVLPTVQRQFMKNVLKGKRYFLPAFIHIKNSIVAQTAPATKRTGRRIKRPTAPSKLSQGIHRQIARSGMVESPKLLREINAAEDLYWDLQGRLADLNDDGTRPENQVECGCCGDECDIRQAVVCTGDNVHFFCRCCVKQYVEVSLIGTGKVRPSCFADEDCSGEIEHNHLSICVDDTTMKRLERMQQQNDLRQAFPTEETTAADNRRRPKLEACPKCEYQAWSDGDYFDNFQCQNLSCKQVSCRSCREKVHHGLTCGQAKSTCSIEHAVAEALSDRLVRTCGKCQNRFVKETDARYCNKMFCSVCRTVSCFICGATGIDYQHFDDPSFRGGRNGACSLWNMPPVNAEAVTAKVMERMGAQKESWEEGKLQEAVKKEIGKHEMNGLIAAK